MNISVYVPRPGEYPDQDPGLPARFAAQAERLGYDAIAASDHPFPVVDGRGHQALDPFVVLTQACAATSRIGLHLNLAVLPYRNPFLLARSTSSLQYVSGGRLILSVGSGYLQQEFAALGARFEDKREQTAATLEALRRAWAGEPVHEATPWWRAEGNRMLPAAEPPIPVWFGGNSRWAIERAVLDCEGWSPHEVTATASARIGTVSVAGVDGLRARIEVMKAIRARSGRARPLDICFTRNLPDWMERPRHQLVEELKTLRDLGVTWLCVRFRPPLAAQLGDQMARFRDLAGVLG